MSKVSVRFLLSGIVVIWAVAIANWLLDYQLNRLGLYPRNIEGLTGIILSPLLHGSFSHLAGNTIAFVTLGCMVSLYDSRRSQLIKLTIFVALVGGLLTWLFARPSFHVGLSGVIFGYWGFITINGFFERSFKSIFISLVAIVLYGGMIVGIMPTSEAVSFEGHAFGAISGIAYSYLYNRKRRR